MQPVDITNINITLDAIYNIISCNKILCDIYKKPDIVEFIKLYLLKLQFETHRYKNKHLIKHVEVIYNMFITNSWLIDTDNCYYKFINLVASTINCRHILQKCSLVVFDSCTLTKLIINISKHGSYITFIYFYFYIKDTHPSILTDIFLNEIFYNSLYNTDDRLYKKLSINPCIILDKNSMINNIFQIYIPIKYILRRLKYINNIVNLDENFCNMIILCKVHNNSFDLISKIVKYYYKNQILTDEILTILAESTYTYNKYSRKPAALEIYSKLNNNYDKNTFIIFLFKYHYTTFNLKINIEKPTDIPLIRNIEFLMNKDHLCSLDLDIINIYKPPELMKIISSSMQWFDENSTKELIIYLFPCIKYFIPLYFNNKQMIIKANKCLLYMRVYIRKIKKKNFIRKKIFNMALLNEMNHLIPSSKPIFKDGTNFYKNRKQKFNIQIPYDASPQINYLDNIFIRETIINSVITFELPPDIYPPINFTNKIKAEYIESLNLYLVYDIDIDMNIEDRYKYLRQLHSKIIYGDTTIESMIDMLTNERKILTEFLAHDYDTYRWYPMAAWKIIKNERNIYEINKNKSKWMCLEGPVQNDGFIITPLNGDREIKIN